MPLYCGGLSIRFPFIVPVFDSVTISDVERTPLLHYWTRRLRNVGEPLDAAAVARQVMTFYDQEMTKRAGQ